MLTNIMEKIVNNEIISSLINLNPVPLFFGGVSFFFFGFTCLKANTLYKAHLAHLEEVRYKIIFEKTMKLLQDHTKMDELMFQNKNKDIAVLEYMWKEPIPCSQKEHKIANKILDIILEKHPDLLAHFKNINFSKDLSVQKMDAILFRFRAFKEDEASLNLDLKNQEHLDILLEATARIQEQIELLKKFTDYTYDAQIKFTQSAIELGITQTDLSLGKSNFFLTCAETFTTYFSSFFF